MPVVRGAGAVAVAVVDDYEAAETALALLVEEHVETCVGSIAGGSSADTSEERARAFIPQNSACGRGEGAICVEIGLEADFEHGDGHEQGADACPGERARCEVGAVAERRK